MQNRSIRLLVLLCCAAGVFALYIYTQQPREQVNVNMFREQSGSVDRWWVQYQLAEPVLRLDFIRTPDQSRVARWSPESAEFMIAVAPNGDEYIQRVDQEPFQFVSFELTPTYTYLEQDYAPFSPFSDGGMAWFSGRFKVCPESCEFAGQYRFYFTMQSVTSDHIVIPGKTATGKLSWYESADDGLMVYVGEQQPRLVGMPLLIDQGLPATMQNEMKASLDPMLDYFAARLGSLETAPMVFASYSDTSNGRYGNQGGVIGSQLFVHWYGRALEERLVEPTFVNDTLWFFAHEVAHLYQRNLFDNEHAWIHEGSAEWMAYRYLESIGVSSAYLNARLERAEKSCEMAGPDDRISQDYACGMLLAKRIDEALLREYPFGIYYFWQEFLVSSGAYSDNYIIFQETLERLTHQQFANSLIQSAP